MTASSQSLREFLVKASVPGSVIDYMVKPRSEDGFGLEAITDFASVFTDKDYEEKTEVLILNKVPDAKDDHIALSRLRSAWVLARAELTRVAAIRSKGAADEDWDSPLPEEVEKVRAEAFDTLYPGQAFEADETPTPPLIGRWFREFKNRAVTLMALNRMRSEAEYKGTNEGRKRKLADDVTITVRGAEPPGLPFETVLEVLWALRLMCNGWAMVGYELVESRLDFNKADGAPLQVRQCHLSAADQYHKFVNRKAIQHPGPEAETIQWILDRHRLTIAKTITLFKAGWPWGEALLEAREHRVALQWSLSRPGVAARQQVVEDRFPPDAAWDNEEESDVEDQRAGRSKRRRGGRAGRPASSKPAGGGKAGGGKASGKGGGKGCNKGGKGTWDKGSARLQAAPCRAFNSSGGCVPRGRPCPENKTHKCSRCGDRSHGAASYDCPARWSG